MEGHFYQERDLAEEETSAQKPSYSGDEALLIENHTNHKRKYCQTEHNSRTKLHVTTADIKLSEHNTTNDLINQSQSKSVVPVIQKSVICGGMGKQNTMHVSKIVKGKSSLSPKAEGANHQAATVSKPPGSFHRISECPICSEVCVNHLHYGGISCYSCKAFFRRSVTAPSEKIKR